MQPLDKQLHFLESWGLISHARGRSHSGEDCSRDGSNNLHDPLESLLFRHRLPPFG